MNKVAARPLITLTTDFGSQSSYVAQMKGVILSRNPSVRIVDISHDIAPQDVLEGAIVLGDVYRWFPKHTIHVAVVDPGVGTERRILCATIGGQLLIAPDNGLLTLVARHARITQLVSISNRTYFLPHVSSTFHGRDIMAPVAAHLSLGLNPKRLGETLDIESLARLSIPEPSTEPQRIAGEVLHIDSFGNLITNIQTSHLELIPDRSALKVACNGNAATGIVRAYGDAATGKLIALIGSSGRLELAVANGSAKEMLSGKKRDAVVVSW